MAIAVLLTGCAAQTRDPLLALAPPALESARASDLLALLAARRQAIPSLSGTAKLRVSVETDSPEEPAAQLSSSQAILVRAPSSFRLEALSPFGVNYVIASDGREIGVLAPGEGYVYRGQAAAATIGAATGVMAEAREVAALLLGLPPVPPLEESAAWVSRGTGGAEAPVVYLHAPNRARAGHTVVVGFARGGEDLHGTPVPVLFESIGRDGELLLRARFGAFRQLAGIPVAMQIRVEAPGSTAELRYRELTLAPEIDGESFTIVTPPGMREAPLGAPRQVGS